MEHSKIRYDIRVVRMAKSTKATRLKDILVKMEDIKQKRLKDSLPVNMNLCLGHFDVMMIDQVGDPYSEEANPMHRVIGDYNKTMDLGRMLGLHKEKDGYFSETTNYFPVYMLMQLNESPSLENELLKLDLFWKRESNYSVIMRLHQEHGGASEPLRRLLLKRLKESDQFPDTCPIKHTESVSDFYAELKVSDTKDNTHQIFCVFYDSLELGDVVGIIKGDSLWAILQVQRWLYESMDVNDAYSYCGIRYDLLASKTIPNDKKKNLPDTSLDYVETRFSVCRTNKAWDFLKDYPGYFVTGSADALQHYEDIPETMFLEKVCNLVHYDKMYDAFNDVVTRIGLKNRMPPRNSGDNPKDPEQKKTIEIKPEFINWLSCKYKESNHPEGEIYAHSLEKLVSSLDAMHSNSVTDALSELMYDGIEALLEQLEYYHNKNYWHENLGEILQEFLDQWSSTTNEILHLESQLFQHPELIPVRFYIPAMVLQFQRIIVLKAMEVIRQIDQKPGSQYVPIMLPKSQNSTVTKAILDPKEHADYSGKSPLCIYVPIHMLYHPYRVSLILCHEIAHYCGHEIREREQRNQIIKKCISYYAASKMISTMGILGKNSSENAKILSKTTKCSDKMGEYFDRIMTENVKDGYLDDVTNTLSQNLGALITNPQVLNDIVRILLEERDADEQIRIYDKIELEGYDKYTELVTCCQEHMEYCLDSLLRECFADVVMILLSDCTFLDYYTCTFHDEFENLEHKQYVCPEDKRFTQMRFYEAHTDRMALVACCINNIRPDWCRRPGKNQERNKALWQTITYEKVESWDEACKKGNIPITWKKYYAQSAKYTFVLLGYEAEQILEYLNLCAQKINLLIHLNATAIPINSVQKLREQISLMKTHQMDWNKLQQILMER